MTAAAAANTSIAALRPAQLAETIRLAFAKDWPLIILGPPGIGKTAIPKQVAADMDMPVIHLHAPTLQAEDFGIPWPRPAEVERETTFRFLIPDRIPVAGSSQSETGLLLLDELPQSGQEAQKVFANILQEREIHGHQLLAGWRIVATGNRVADRTGAAQMLAHLRDRMVQIELASGFEDWDTWAGEIDQDTGKPRVHHEVRAYIRARGGAPLFDFDPHRMVNATPRAWAEKVSPALTGTTNTTILRAVIAGSIGPAQMVEFMAFRGLFGILPSRDEFLANPEKVVNNLPLDVRVQVVDEAGVAKERSMPRADLLYALASMCISSLNPQTYRAALKAATFLKDDFGAFVLLSFTKQFPTLLGQLPQQEVTDILARWRHLIFPDAGPGASQ